MVFIYLIIMNALGFVLMRSDKEKAIRNKWRIPEKTLLLGTWLLGGVGAYAGMRLFRHKTKHWYFWAVNIIGLIWQIALAVFLFIKF